MLPILLGLYHMTEHQEHEQQQTPLVWRGPSPYLSIKIRPSIPTDAFWNLPVVYARRDLSEEVEDDGVYEIPLLLAAPMYVLLKKHEADLAKDGTDGSFINEIEFPTRMKPSRTRNLDYIYNRLKDAPTLKACEAILHPLPTRLVFEVLVLIVQQMRLNFKMSPALTEFMIKVDFSTPYLWNSAAGTENGFKKYAEDRNLSEDDLIIRLSNKVADIWAVELENTVEKPTEKLMVRFIMANLTRIVGSYFRALNNQFPNDRHLSIKVNKDPNSGTNSRMQVLGLKFGRFLVTLDEGCLKNKFSESESFYHYQHTLPANVIKNLLLLNTSEMFKPSPKTAEYIFHDKEGCNFENPECVCQHKNME
ncbi:hypothetical protein ACTXT7_001107 [Hymenolepis weldensis]